MKQSCWAIDTYQNNTKGCANTIQTEKISVFTTINTVSQLYVPRNRTRIDSVKHQRSYQGVRPIIKSWDSLAIWKKSKHLLNPVRLRWRRYTMDTAMRMSHAAALPSPVLVTHWGWKFSGTIVTKRNWYWNAPSILGISQILLVWTYWGGQEHQHRTWRSTTNNAYASLEKSWGVERISVVGHIGI